MKGHEGQLLAEGSCAYVFFHFVAASPLIDCAQDISGKYLNFRLFSSRRSARDRGFGSSSSIRQRKGGALILSLIFSNDL